VRRSSPIVPICRARSVNDVGVPRPDTISPLPEGIPLLDAERIAREREPGDGAAQTPALAQLAAAID